MEKIPLPTVRRLPAYLQILRAEKTRKKEWTSTTMLSESLRLKAIQGAQGHELCLLPG